EVLERLTWSGTDGTVVAADKDSPLHLIALDGLATGACEPRATIDLYPGYRCDVLVKAPAQTGEYFLAAAAPSAKTALRKRNVGAPAKYLVKVVVAGPPHEMRLPDASDHLDRCRPFKDVAAAKAEKSRSIEFFLDDGNKVYKINDQSFSQQTDPAEIRPALGTTELWTLRVKSGEFIKPDLHPFHVHVNPFQVVIIRARKKDGTWVDVSQLAADPDQRPWLDLLGKWKDTLVVDSNHEVTVGMRFADWAGRTVLHCHILDHEDQGMMRVVDILQANGQPLRPIGLQPADSPAPAVRLTDVRGRPCDLAAAGDGRPAVLVFFRGFGCVHCTRQLRVLARETATRLPEKGAVLLAVTDQPIGSPTAALKELGIPDGIEFRLFEDPKGVAFKRYGCLDPDPRHGLFVIDPAGRVRFRYLGDRPLDDAEAVVEAVREFLPTRARRRD
ncbi:MAG: multicopper oxidase domain-containing protein, partial [Zavarzinella sp.]|nr:multicopper oxidase domain-containing protein [Zavarzinella sp.]